MLEKRSVFQSEYLITAVAALLAPAALYLLSLHSYLLFHAIAEMFVVAVAASVFIIAWNTRRIVGNGFLILLGVSLLFVAVLDTVHTLAYEGMGLFDDQNSNLPTQLWISARYLQSISFLAAPFMLGRKVRSKLIILVYASVTALILAAVFYWKIFPLCFVEGVGLTPFKKISEYVISLIFAGAIFALYRKREVLEPSQFNLLTAAIIFSIGSELAFTFYISSFDFSNLIGHFLKILAFYFIYKAIVAMSLVTPHRLLFRDLKQSEERFRSTLDNMLEGCQIIGHDWRYFYINDVAEAHNRRPREELIGNTYMDMWPGIEQTEVFRVIRRSLKERVIERMINEFTYPDGKIGWFELIMQPVPEGVFILSSDITEKKRLEDEIKLAADEWGLTFDTIPDLIMIIGEDHRVLRMNRPCAEALGIDRDELPLKHCYELVHRTGEPHRLCPHSRTMSDGREHGEEVFEPSLGRHFLVTTTPLSDGSGKTLGSVHVMRDITGRKQAEEDLLRYSEINSSMAELSRSLLEHRSIEDISWLVVEKAKSLTGSPLAFAHYMDPATGHVIAPTLTGEVWEECQIPNKTFVFDAWRGLWGWCIDHHEMILTNEACSDPRRCGTPDGHIPIERYLSVPAMIGDKLVGLVAVANSAADYGDEQAEILKRLAVLYAVAINRKWTENELARHRDNLEDMVEMRNAEISWVNRELKQEVEDHKRAVESLRRSESSLAEAQRMASLGNWDWNILTNDLYWSDEIYRIFGLEPREFGATYDAFLTSVHPDDRGLVTAAVDEALASRRPYGIEHRVVRPGGLVRVVHERAEVTYDGEGRPVRMIGTVQDITERKQVEEEKQRVETELEKQRTQSIHADRLRSLGEMAAAIAHELNQPLSGVRGLAEHLAIAIERGWSISNEDVAEKVRLIMAQADRMSHVIEHTRMFAREADSDEITPVQVNEVIESSLGMIGAQLRARGITLECRLNPGLPLVMANCFSLEEVILNLLANARDALSASGEDEPGPIRIHTNVDGGPGHGYVYIEVADQGPGISPEIIERVFDPFFTTKDPHQGTGLGLSIARNIIEGFKGKIAIESRPGQGTRVIISLPAIGRQDNGK